MVEARWGTGILIFTLSVLQSRAAPFHPMSASMNPSTTNEAKENTHSMPQSEEDTIYSYYPLGAPLSNDLDEQGNVYLPPADLDADDSSEIEKRARNFLRFGRIHQNFLRFGRGGGGSPLQYALGPVEATEEEKRARNFLRFGKAYDKNYLRFGRAHDRNFLRFGRSTNTQGGELESTNIKDNAQGFYRVHSQKAKPVDSNAADTSNRAKRNVPSYYTELLSAPPTSLTWDTPLADLFSGPSLESPSNDPHPQASKRAHSRNFLRFGRDPLDYHFLRFGKRSSDDLQNLDPDNEANIDRQLRGGVAKNFLRFG